MGHFPCYGRAVRAPRQRRFAVATLALLAMVMPAGCGGSDDKPKATTPQGPADRTQRTEAGARATLREYAVAVTSSDGVKICDLLDPTSAAMASASKARCRREAARLKGVLSATEKKNFREKSASLEPVVNGNEATLPGSSEAALRYIVGRWYVVPVPPTEDAPTS